MTQADHDVAATAFTLEHVFLAPLEKVWRAWSEADQLRHWWGPQGCAVDVLRFEFQPGGFFHYAMNFSGMPPMWGRFNFRQIVPKQRIVWLNSFATVQGGIERAPFSDQCPFEIENTVDFTERGGATTVSLRAVPFGANAEELAYFAALHASMAQGYGGTFDQLVAHLSKG